MSMTKMSYALADQFTLQSPDVQFRCTWEALEVKSKNTNLLRNLPLVSVAWWKITSLNFYLEKFKTRPWILNINLKPLRLTDFGSSCCRRHLKSAATATNFNISLPDEADTPLVFYSVLTKPLKNSYWSMERSWWRISLVNRQCYKICGTAAQPLINGRYSYNIVYGYLAIIYEAKYNRGSA